MAASTAPLKEILLPYKKDHFGNDITARVIWAPVLAPNNNNKSRPIAMIYHAGGLIAGSASIVPSREIAHLCTTGFIAILPNYRLVPQVSGRDSFRDAEDAYDWAVGGALSSHPLLLEADEGLKLDTRNVVALGHSSGGTMALHLSSLRKPGLKAVTALYPFLFVSDATTNAHGPADKALFAHIPAPGPLTPEEEQAISPPGIQLAEAPMPIGGGTTSTPSPRNKWLMGILRNGTWLQHLQPDGDYAAIDPMTRTHADLAPTYLIHGSEDTVPGRSEALIRRAGMEVAAAIGEEKVRVEVLEGCGHLFDHLPGTTEKQWGAVGRGLEWLVRHAQ